ncbi:MAG: bifunctional hydroxymethylpyrimidine kinase/phosphomethylpyrimidine kinase [Chloroherpetonaceae bacterium]|nr:bifunctional hydroxymethylpyrimidine kinase/phosphomethylpyrimidine kinase [Chloroherpetonaceae bacterium]
MIYKKLLTIAGSDSGGGAGIQADIKTFSALGCYGMSVLTALTAQNTIAVTAIHDLPPSFIKSQLDAVFSDIGADAVKIGMLSTPEVIETVANALEEYKPRFVVLDPVMVAKSGDKLLRDEAIHTLKSRLIPMSTILTPNLPEAAILLEDASLTAESSNAQLEESAQALCNFGANAVLLKGGHRNSINGEIHDCLINDEKEMIWIKSVRLTTPNTHGTGCTLSSAIAAYLAKGMSLTEAVRNASKYLSGAIEAGSMMKLGKSENGHGPVHHFYQLWSHT